MRNLRKHLPSGLRRPTFALAVMTGSLLFLVQCRSSDVGDFGFQKNIAEHFGDMHYAKTTFSSKMPPRKTFGVYFQSGEGALLDRDGQELSYKWIYLTGDNGDLLTGYIGTSRMTSTVAVALTRDETKEAIRRCAANDDINERFACFDRVVDKMVKDCQFSMSFADCQEACFYDPSQCRPLKP